MIEEVGEMRKLFLNLNLYFFFVTNLNFRNETLGVEPGPLDLFVFSPSHNITAW